MKKYIFVIAVGLLILFQFSNYQYNTPNKDENYTRGEVVEVLSEERTKSGEEEFISQEVKVLLDTGEEVNISNEGILAFNEHLLVKDGDQIIVSQQLGTEDASYYISDRYRMPWFIGVFIFFIVLTVIFAGFKGFSSIVGLMFSLLVIVQYIVPNVLNGADPVVISLSGAFAIAIVSLYFAHGFNKRTSIAVIGTLCTLVLATFLSILFVTTSKLFGMGSEEAFFLQVETLDQINLQGLLLGGIIIGVLGVLDDITTAQSATVHEIKKANPNLPRNELYKRGISVGREHITSLVNTLVLAYAGAAFPMFMLFAVDNNQPLWVILNTEFIGEEVIRTLVGSTALVLAVPITTYLAAWYFGKMNKAELEASCDGPQPCHH